MTSSNVDDHPCFPESRGLKLSEIAPGMASWLAQALVEAGRGELCNQIPRIVMPPQQLSGTAEEFSFMAYAVPYLSVLERQFLEIRDFERLRLPYESGTIELALDSFGQIDWFYMGKLSTHYGTFVTASRGK